MKVFYIKGLSGLMMFLLALLGIVGLVVVLPSTFVMVLWNALVYEGLGWLEISIGQALILWAAIMVLINLVMKPQISLQFRRAADSADLNRPLGNLKKSEGTED